MGTLPAARCHGGDAQPLKKVTLVNIRLAAIIAGGVLVSAKVALLVAFGPIFLPDTTDYVLFADMILAGGEWLHTVLPADALFPVTAFRVIGYPLLLAWAKLAAGDAWPWVAVLAQLVLSLAATALVFLLAVRLSGRPWLGLVAAVGHGTGQVLVLDQCILTDSLNASLLVSAGCWIGISMANRRPPRAAEMAGLGAAVLAALLLREAGAFLQYALWPLAIAWCLTTGTGARRSIILIVLFALPPFLGAQAYKAWNAERTGHRFITTAAQTAVFRPALDLYRRGIPVFADDPLLADEPALKDREFPLPGVAYTTINHHLTAKHGFRPWDVAGHAYATYLRHWRTHFTERVGIVLSKFDKGLLYLPLMPVVGTERVALWSGGITPLPAPGQVWQRVVADMRLDLGFLLAVRTLARVASVLITAAAVLGIPWLLWKGWRRGSADPRAPLLAAYWLFGATYVGAYALVHMEERYLVPVVPFILICGLSLLAPSFEAIAARTRRTFARN